MQITAYVDGSFGDERIVHGGLYYITDGHADMLHVTSSNPQLVEMRNVGGEVLAAFAAILFSSTMIKASNKPGNLKVVYDYKGVGCWINGEWQAKKPATQWFKNAVGLILREVPLMTLKMEHVKGHSGDKGNELADAIADYTMNYCRMSNVDVIDMDKFVHI